MTLTLGRFTFDKPIVMNGAGFCKNGDLAEALARDTNLGAIVIGSITQHARNGNPGNTYFFDERHNVSINSLGLPNPGIDAIEAEVPSIVERINSYGKPLIFSIAAFSEEEFFYLAMRAVAMNANAIEVNFGCPNMQDGGIQHGIFAFDLEVVTRVMTMIKNAVRILNFDFRPSIGMKVSPYEPGFLVKMATRVKEQQLADFVTVSNTMPNTLVLDANKKPVLDQVVRGYGGGAGPGFFPTALGQVAQWHSVLGDMIPILGVGGATYRSDVEDFIAYGAAAVQVTTYLWECHGDISRVNDLIPGDNQHS